jgi:hypothetical protein
MTAVVEPTYRSPNSDLATRSRNYGHTESVKPTSSSDNSAAWDCTGGDGWTYQNLFPAKTSTFASVQKSENRRCRPRTVTF